jgi:hypothetical protein
MTTPPRDTDPADSTLPYGPPAPADHDPDDESPAETSDGIDAEIVPDHAALQARRKIRSVKVLSLFAVLGGLIGTLVAYLAYDIRRIELGTLVLILSVLLVLVCAAPVRLLMLGRRHRHPAATRRAATSATVWGVIFLGLGSLAVVPTLVGTAGWLIEDLAIRSRPPTAAEGSVSPAELRAQAETMISDLAAAADAVPAGVLPGDNPAGLRSEPCVLSNLGPGVIISSSGYRFSTPGESVAALDAVEAYWREAGYEPRRAGGDSTVDGIHPQVRVSGGSIERMGVYAPNDITYNTLLIEYRSICVAE